MAYASKYLGDFKRGLERPGKTMMNKEGNQPSSLGSTIHALGDKKQKHLKGLQGKLSLTHIDRS